jgi:signal transduction histidine kinase
VIGQTATDLQWITTEQRQTILHMLNAEGRIVDMDLDLRKKNGEMVHRLYSCETMMLGGQRCLLSISIDITQRKHAEEVRKRLESELLQSQKMESIGRLAGGIAHDFNNMLTPILGYSELLKKTFPEDDKRRHRLDQIVRAAESSRNLVMNLLAFARKQNLEMKPVNISVVISDFSKILHRVVRENVALTLKLNNDTGLIYGDPGQIEQVLLNLCVNAHDAMPDGGTVVIETTGTTFREDTMLGAESIPAGTYVCLSVRDSGTGIKSHLIPMIFEPFFTTKDKGKGTGLGLSTVYGIVKQHKGYIFVESAAGTGTEFKVFFPVRNDLLIERVSNTAVLGSLNGTGRIFVAEDNAEVRTLVEETLIQYGYTVISEDSISNALKRFRNENLEIDLLLSDVLFTDGIGTELYEDMKKVIPHLKVLYMSGYSGEIISRHNVRNEGINFISKPFMPDALAAKVRIVLTGDHDPV